MRPGHELAMFFLLAVLGHVASTLWFNAGYVLWAMLTLLLVRMSALNGFAVGLGWSLPPALALVVNLPSYALPAHLNLFEAVAAPLVAYCGSNCTVMALAAWVGIKTGFRGTALVAALWVCALPPLLPLSAGSMLPILASCIPGSGYSAFIVATACLLLIASLIARVPNRQFATCGLVTASLGVIGLLSTSAAAQHPVHNDIWAVDPRGELNFAELATQTRSRWSAGQRFVVTPESVLASLTPEVDAGLVALGRVADSRNAKALVGVNVTTAGRAQDSALVVGQPEAGILSALVTMPLVGRAAARGTAHGASAQIGLERLVVLFCYEEMTLAPLWKRLDRATLVASLANHYWDRVGWITRQQLMYSKRWAKIFGIEIWRADATYNGASIHA